MLQFIPALMAALSSMGSGAAGAGAAGAGAGEAGGIGSALAKAGSAIASGAKQFGAELLKDSTPGAAGAATGVTAAAPAANGAVGAPAAAAAGAEAAPPPTAAQKLAQFIKNHTDYKASPFAGGQGGLVNPSMMRRRRPLPQQGARPVAGMTFGGRRGGGEMRF